MDEFSVVKDTMGNSDLKYIERIFKVKKEKQETDFCFSLFLRLDK